MQKKILLGCTLLLSFLSLSLVSYAQTAPPIETIEVNLASDSNKKEATPALNLEQLRKAAREDSIKIAELANQKAESEKEKLEKLRLQRLKEKEEREKKAKALAEKRKLEKEAREKALAEKRAQKEDEEKAKNEAEKLAKEEAKKLKKEEKLKERAALAEKKQAEKEAQAQKTALAKEKAKKEKAILAKQKEAERLVEQQKIAAEKEAQEKEKAILAQQKEAERAAEQQKIAAEKEAKKTTDIDQSSEVAKETRTPPVQAEANKPKTEVNEIKVPEGVVQKDNAYGTVRIAYDELATSFLLSIPSETKMHYHKEHTEQIMLIEGEGMVLLGYKTIKLKKNELIFVTKGTPHKIINSGKSKLKVLSIQSPFYSGKDIIILE